MTERSCLICGITEAEVIATRNRDGYTLGCGIEHNTENGFDYDELSPRHRWAPWRDSELDRMGIKPDAYDRYRTIAEVGIRYAPCADTKRGHVYAAPDDEFGYPAGRCYGCGRPKATGNDEPKGLDR